MINKKLLIQAVIAGIIWGVMFYFIRKGMNKRNFAADPEKKRADFFYDSIYGGIAAALTVIVKEVVGMYLSNTSYN